MTTLGGSQAALTLTHAYVSRYGEAIVAVDLATGSARRVTVVRGPDLLSVSPDGSHVAFYDSGRLRVVDTAMGAARSRTSRYGWVIEWLDPQRLLFRIGGNVLVYDTELHRLRRYPFVRMYGQARVADRLYGTDRYRLRSLNLATGRKRTVAGLTDRGIVDLVGVPERPPIEPGSHRPDAPTATMRSSSSVRCSRPRMSTPAPRRPRR